MPGYFAFRAAVRSLGVVMASRTSACHVLKLFSPAKCSSLGEARRSWVGCAPSTARRGKAALSQSLLEALARESNKLELLGRKISPERQANLVRGRLVQNVILGPDKGTPSAKQLGADKRISMWQPDSQVGVVILSQPPIPKLDHEVPWIKSKFQEEKELKASRENHAQAQSHEEEPEEKHEPEGQEPLEAPSEAEVWEEEEKKAER